MTSELSQIAPSSKVALRRSRVREDLARAAIELMAEKGFEATTIDEIAAAADYHRSSFFRYFASKEEAVFVGVPELTESFRAACAPVRRARGNRWPLIREALVGTVRDWTAGADQRVFARQFQLWNSDPALQGALAVHLLAWGRIITEALEPTDRGTPYDVYAHLVGGALMSTLRAAVESGTAQPEGFIARLEQACQMLEDGLARRPSR